MGTSRTLVKLSEVDLVPASPDEDIRDRKVLDRHGEEIGTVKDLLVDQDPDDPKVRFIEVGAGGLLGIGEQTFLVPVDAVTRVSPEEVRIDQTSERIREAPRYDPDLVRDEGYYEDVSGWWGYGPYWAPGYIYPQYPRYPYDPPV
jgi:sporulation protein YlmC with PRC-barrel domain